MKFEKLRYQQAKQQVISLIKQTHAWETDEGFIADGIICPEIYEKEKLKILVILAESYGYSNSRDAADIEDQLEDDIMGLNDSKVKTPKKVAALLWLLFKSLENGEAIKWAGFPDFMTTNDFNYKELQAVLSKIAWINLKKASSSSTKFKEVEIRNAGKRNKEIIELQIQSIAPDLIIAFSYPVIDSLYDNKLLGDGLKPRSQEETMFKIQTNTNGQRIFYMTHPSYPVDWASYESMYDLFQILYTSLLV
jgi:hypothetical protein